jgi:hypothetical protein
MLFDLNIWAVLASAISSVLIGFVWYMPQIFGTMWMRLANIQPQDTEQSSKLMPAMAAVSFVASFVMAWVLAHFAFVWGALTIGSALELAFWVWLGFFVPILLGPVLWERKPIQLFAINAGYWLVSIGVMSIIITLWV